MADGIVGYDTPEECVAALRLAFPDFAHDITEDDVASCDHCGKHYDAEEEMASLGGDRWVTGRDGTEGLMAYPATCHPCQDEEMRRYGFGR